VCSAHCSGCIQTLYLDTGESHDKAHCQSNQSLAFSYIELFRRYIFWIYSAFYPLGTLWLDFAEHSKCAQLFAHWVHWSHMTGHIQNILSMCPLGISGSHSRVYLKCTQHLITGHIGVTCWLCSQCFHHVPSGYLGPCPQCHPTGSQPRFERLCLRRMYWLRLSIAASNSWPWVVEKGRESDRNTGSYQHIALACLAARRTWPSRPHPNHTCTHWGQGPKYPLDTWWKHWDHSQHVTPICPAIKCWVHFEYTPLCAPDMPSGHILSTFWMFPAIWLQCTQWANNWAHFECSAKSNHNVPSG